MIWIVGIVALVAGFELGVMASKRAYAKGMVELPHGQRIIFYDSVRIDGTTLPILDDVHYVEVRATRDGVDTAVKVA